MLQTFIPCFEAVSKETAVESEDENECTRRINDVEGNDESKNAEERRLWLNDIMDSRNEESQGQ